MKSRLKPGVVSFTKHRAFAQLRKYLYLDYTGARDNFRIQLSRRKMPHELRHLAHRATTPCVACGSDIHPLRNGKYFAATCPITVDISCSRTANAGWEYHTIRKAIEAA